MYEPEAAVKKKLVLALALSAPGSDPGGAKDQNFDVLARRDA